MQGQLCSIKICLSNCQPDQLYSTFPIFLADLSKMKSSALSCSLCAPVLLLQAKLCSAPEAAVFPVTIRMGEFYTRFMQRLGSLMLKYPSLVG